MKLVGLGVAAGVLIDVTVIRMVPVPSRVELLGDANWRMPRSLQRRLPKIGTEAPDVASVTPEGAIQDGQARVV